MELSCPTIPILLLKSLNSRLFNGFSIVPSIWPITHFLFVGSCHPDYHDIPHLNQLAQNPDKKLADSTGMTPLVEWVTLKVLYYGISRRKI
jgi:hypothetical protein